ncbi:MAG: ATP synthase subunit I [Deltaproteobacteria bacterium]|nr:ATP synthase subunit I [Deltaproteobacteria bacterium]
MAKEALKTDGAEGGQEGRTDGGALTDDGAQGSVAAGEMDSNDSQADYSAVSSAASTVAYKAGVANLVAGGVGTIASAMMISGMVAVGFAAGYMIGVANIWMLLNIAKKGVEMTPQEAGKYVASRYYLRYSATIIALSVLIATGLVGAGPALAGLTVCIFTTIAAIIFAAREGVY